MNIKILAKALFGLMGSAALVGLAALAGRSFPQYWLAIVCAVFFILLVIAWQEAGKYKKTGGEYGSIVYLDYYDIFKCLSIVMVPLVVIFLGLHFQQSDGAFIFSGIYVALMLIHIAYVAAGLNSWLMLPVIILVKIALSVIWVLAFYQMLNPSGTTYGARRKTRAVSVIAMLLVTPVITRLVLGDEGKALIQSGLKGRRFGGAKALRGMLKE